MANVKEIEWQGGIYNIADETARGEAQQARALANTAQASANTAQTSADNAQTTANTAQTTANAAQTTANTAQTTAQNAASGVSSLNTRVSNIETALEDTVFQIPLTSGLTPEPGYNNGVKSGNTVTIRIGAQTENIPADTIIATLPASSRPKVNTIQPFVEKYWILGGSVEITTAGDIILKTSTSGGVFFTATFIA